MMISGLLPAALLVIGVPAGILVAVMAWVSPRLPRLPPDAQVPVPPRHPRPALGPRNNV